MKAVRKQNKYEHRVSKFSFKKNPRDLPIKSFTLTLWQHSAVVTLHFHLIRCVFLSWLLYLINKDLTFLFSTELSPSTTLVDLLSTKDKGQSSRVLNVEMA